MRAHRLSPERWRIVSPLLDEALDRDGEARKSWLVTLRAQDPSLATDVETLLREGEALQRERFLEGPAPPPPLGSLAGLTLGAYTLVSQIGQGGMGSVWLAERSDGRFEGLAAVKLLNASLVGKDGEARLRREAHILARLQHPHIARLLDAGLSPSGQPYLVLEHVEGEHIDRYCDSRSLGVEVRLRLFLDVLEAVALAHANLTVHRDIKPSNVLVGRDAQVKLLDFGIAKLLEEGAGVAGVTRDGEAVLTPEHASPEQLTGGDVTTATDVYALGVLLYLLLAGRHPTGAGAGSVAELIKATVETEPLRLSDAAAEAAPRRGTTPGRLRALLRGDLDNVVAKALRKDPRERYASATAFADDLRRHLRHEPVSARPDSVAYRTRKFVRRHRAGVGLAAVAILGVLLAGAVAVSEMLEARRQRDAAVLETRRARASSELARLALGDGVEAERPDIAHGRLDRVRKLLHGSLIDDPRIRAHLLLELVSRYQELGDLKVREELMEEVRGTNVRLDDPGLGAALACVDANVQVDAGHFDQAEQEIARGYRLLRSAPPAEDDPWPECLLADSYRLVRSGHGRDAVERARRAVGWLEEHGQRYTLTYSDALYALGGSGNIAGRYREALGAIRKSYELRQQISEGTPPALMVSKNGEAVILRAGGHVLEARDVIEGVVAPWQNAPATAVPDYVLAVQGRVASDLAQHDRAIELLHRSIAQARSSGRERASFETRVFLLTALTRAGRTEEARQELDVLEQDRAAGRLPEGPVTLSLLVAKARVLEAMKELETADGAAHEALSALRARAEAEAPPLREAAAVAAEIALARRETDEGCRSEQVALDCAGQEAIDPASSAWVGEALLLKARCDTLRGYAVSSRADAAAAVPHLERNLGPDHPLALQARALQAGR
jgi:serine/threonine protein kinase/tetratricopeptide (TPR) repeat protein